MRVAFAVKIGYCALFDRDAREVEQRAGRAFAWGPSSGEPKTTRNDEDFARWAITVSEGHA